MATQPGVAERMFRALAERGINIQMITTSEIKISVLVAREYARRPCGPCTRPSGWTRAGGRRAATPAARPPPPTGNPTEIVARLESMEDLIIEDIAWTSRKPG